MSNSETGLIPKSEVLFIRDKPNPFMMAVWRVMNFVMTIFFILSAAANLNDFDWYLWVPIYSVPALLTMVSFIWPYVSSNNFIWKTIASLHIIICIVYAAYQIYSLVLVLEGKVQNPLQHEEGRELFGLFIIILWLGVSRYSSFGRASGGLNSQAFVTITVAMVVMLTVMPMLLWGICFVGDWHTKLGHCSGMFKPSYHKIDL